MASTTSDTGDTSSKQQQAQRKENAKRATVCIRAATNVRTFDYYSFEILTNELFYERTFVDARCHGVGLFLVHAYALRSEAAGSRVGAMHEWRYS